MIDVPSTQVALGMPGAPDEPPNTPPVAVGEPYSPVDTGSKPLRNPRHERYARARSLLRPKIEAYRYAFEHEESLIPPERTEIHALRGNASKLERRKDVLARIAWLSRDDEEALKEKRKRLEERLWLVHDANLGDLWEVAERPLLNPVTGEPILKDGVQIMVKYERAKFVSELPGELQHAIESVTVTDSGKRVPKLYSKMQANVELRKLHGIGATRDADDDFARMTDHELLSELGRQAKDLGINVELTFRGGV